MTQEKVESIMIISYLKSITEVQARIIKTLEDKPYKDIHRELSKNVLDTNIRLLESYRDNNYKNNLNEQSECNERIKQLKEQLTKL